MSQHIDVRFQKRICRIVARHREMAAGYNFEVSKDGLLRAVPSKSRKIMLPLTSMAVALGIFILLVVLL